jgi:spore coat protein H
MKSGKVFALLFTLLCFSSFLSVEGAAPVKKTKSEIDDLFVQPKVFQIKIEIPSASLESLKNDPRKYVRGVVREGSRVFNDAGIRLKGSGTFQSLEKRPSLTIKFNEFVSGVRFYGHSKLFLNNSHQDPTFLCEAIGGELFRAAGVPAPRDNFARVELNGRDLGLFVLEEAVNKDFLGKYFTRTKGNLYEGSKVDINEKLQKDSGDDSKEQKELKGLAAALKEPDPAARLKKISTMLDLDRFLSFAATEVFAWHHNGYTMGADNYRIYADPATNRMVFIPHGYEQLFGKPNGPLTPEWKGLVMKAIIETPEGKVKYRERMSKLLATAFKPEAITARISQLASVIKPAAGSGSTQAQTFDAALTQLRERVTQRAAFLSEELKKAN